MIGNLFGEAGGGGIDGAFAAADATVGEGAMADTKAGVGASAGVSAGRGGCEQAAG